MNETGTFYTPMDAWNTPRMIRNGLKVLTEEGWEMFMFKTRRYISWKLQPSYHSHPIFRGKATEELTKLITTNSPTIIDGGAHKGETTAEFKRAFSDPKIIAFEPQPLLAEKIQKEYENDDGVEVYNTAIGAEKKAKKLYKIGKYSGRSSLFTPKYSNHGADDVEKRIDVQMQKLDDCISEKVDILKLDLQGYELNALKGANNVLKNTDVILTEVQFKDLYENASTFCDIHKYLTQRRFKLYNLYTMSTNPDDGHLEWGDAIYVSEDMRI